MRLVWLDSAWLIGIALGLGRAPGQWAALLAWSALAALAFALLLPGVWRPLLLLAVALVCCGLGTWRASLVRHPPATLPAGTITAIRGVVRDWPIRGDRADTAIIAVETVRVADGWSEGTALLRVELSPAPAVGRGDRVEVRGYYRSTGTIELAGFRSYLERQGLHGQFRGSGTTIVAVGGRGDLATWRARQLAALEADLRRHIPGAEGALTTGVLLGDDRLLPPATRAAFTSTGTAHIMALSGWNVALVAGLCAIVGRGLGRGRSLAWMGLSALAIWFFVLFVGASPTLIRAAIMGMLYLAAEAVGRRGDALNALALAAIGMTAFSPGALLDIGFQLSCAATLGLIAGTAPLLAGLRRFRLPPLVAAPTAATIAADLATLPLSLHHFGQFSLVTLPTNLLVEWPVPLIMAGGVATGIAGWLWGPLADLWGLLTWLPARAMLLAVEGMGALPWADRKLAAPGWPTVAALYAAFGLALSLPRWSALLRERVGHAVIRARPTVLPLLGGALGGLTIWACLILLLG